MIKQPDGGYIMERADKEREIKQLFDQLDYAMDNVQIAMNALRYYYGVKFVDVDIRGDGEHRVLLWCGIDEVAQVLGRKVKMSTWMRATKEFNYKGNKIVQLAEQNSMHFTPLNYDGKALYRLDDETEGSNT